MLPILLLIAGMLRLGGIDPIVSKVLEEADEGTLILYRFTLPTSRDYVSRAIKQCLQRYGLEYLPSCWSVAEGNLTLKDFDRVAKLTVRYKKNW